MTANADRTKIGLRVIPADTERDMVIVLAAGRGSDLDLTHRAFAVVTGENTLTSGGGKRLTLHARLGR
jgi:hypothetical protein